MTVQKISKKILLVDDETMLLKSWSRALAKEGCEVVCAQNGVEALEAAKSQEFSVIFSDMNMPRINGEELLKRLCGIGCDACINIITGLAEVSTAVASMRLGACDYIQKPCDLEELLALTRRCLGHALERKAKKELQAKLTTYEELDRLKSEFVSNVSHELRTPIFSMKGAFDLLCQDLTKTNSDPKPLTDVIGRNLERLSQLINNVLDYSRIEKGTLKTTFEKINLTTIVSETIELLTPLFKQRNIAMPVVVSLGAPLVIDADAVQLRQVLTNLLTNAIKFTSLGGKISIDLADGGQEIEIVVSDSGIGIHPQYHEKIFERFFQVDGSIIREAGGSGIGLAIVKAITENHGGKILVESDVGKGSRFHVILPKNHMNLAPIPHPSLLHDEEESKEGG